MPPPAREARTAAKTTAPKNKTGLAALIIAGLAAATVVSCGTAPQPGTAATGEPSTTPSTPEPTATTSATPATTTTSTPTSAGIDWVTIGSPETILGRLPVEEPLALDRLGRYSDMVVRGQIVAIEPGDFMVPDATRQAFDHSGARLWREANATIGTPVRILVHDVMAVRADHRPEVDPGDDLSLWTIGGTATFTVTPDEAAATGLRPGPSNEEEQAIIDSGREPPNGPGPVPDEPWESGVWSAQHLSIAEGQEVVAFLTWADWYDTVANDGSSYDDVRLLLAIDGNGLGLFVRASGSAMAGRGPFSHAPTGQRFELEELELAATAVNGLTGPVDRLDRQTTSLFSTD